MRSVTGTPDNDLDHAEWLNGDDARTPDPRGRELSPADASAALSRIWADIQARRAEAGPVRRCPHGINEFRAACGRCLDSTFRSGAR